MIYLCFYTLDFQYLQGYPQRILLQRRLYGIYSVFILTLFISCQLFLLPNYYDISLKLYASFQIVTTLEFYVIFRFSFLVRNLSDKLNIIIFQMTKFLYFYLVLTFNPVLLNNFSQEEL